MKDYIVCKPVMLPAPLGCYGNCLVKVLGSNQLLLSAGESERSYYNRTPQFIYLISDEEIKEGDYYFVGNSKASNHKIVQARSLEERKRCQ